jgi:hypothetical protein
LGYIAGTLDMIRALQAQRVMPKTFCEHQGVTPDQLVAVWQSFVAKHPEQRHLVAATLIPEMMREAFPCR